MTHFITRNARRLTYAALLCLGFFSSRSVTAQLSGTYTIDPSSSASSTNYQTIASAVSDMTNGTRADGGTANGSGVSGAVTFNIADGNYNEQISIGAISGASSTNTITFQSKNGDSSKVIWYYASSSSSTNNYTLDLNHAKYITFKHISIQRTGTAAYFVDVYLEGNTKYINFIGCLLTTKMVASATSPGISPDNPVIYSVGTDSFNTYQGNRIKHGYNGICFYGGTMYQNSIIGNTIDTSGMAGVESLGSNGLVITGNTFNEGPAGSSQYLSYGIRFESGTNYTITKNRIYSTSSATVCRCVVIFSGSVSGGKRNLIANNMIWVSAGSSSSTGITIGGTASTDIFYNNVLMTSTSSAPSAALYFYSGYTNTDDYVENNNFVNMGTGYAVDNEISTRAFLRTMQYNNLYTKGTYIGKYGSSTYTTFANWYGAGYDTNSLNVDPGYVSHTDLHVSNSAIDGKGTPVSAVTDDIDGDTRSSSAPDIGADEFTPSSLDAGVTVLDSPKTYCAGLKNIIVKFTNFGTTTLTSADIHWSVNGTAQTTYSWTGSLAQSVVSSDITIGSLTLASNTPYTIKVWTTSPNGGTDSKNTNDTLTKTINSGMSGTYTIGGSSPDFTTFNAALDAINVRSLCGPVTFKVRNGTYTEQLTVPAYPALSSTNTVTFQSESGDNTKVILQQAGANSNGVNNVTLQLNGASYVTFKDMTIAKTGTGFTYQSVIELKGGAHNNTFMNNRIMGVKVTSASTTYDIVTSASDVDYANVFRKNYFKYGSSAFGIYGTSSSAHEYDNVIDSNTVDSTYSNAIAATYNDNITISNNTIINGPTGGGYYGIELSSGTGSTITANKVILPSGAAGGIYLSSNPGTSSASGLIANNYVSIAKGGSTTPYGIYLNSSGYENVYFNTVDIYNSNTGAAFYATSTSNVNVEDNIFYNNGGGYAIYAGSSSAITNSDYNDLYTTGSYVGNYGGTNEAKLKDWQSASSLDANSLSIDPTLASNTDYHTKNTYLHGVGTALVAVPKDIEGTVRDTTSPDMGALEFHLLDNESGVTAVASPSSTICPGKQNVTVKLRNFGGKDISNVTINWAVDGVAQTAYKYTSTISAGSSASATIGTYTFSTTKGTTITAWTSDPNGVTDSFPYNDSASATIVVAAKPTASVGGSTTICSGSSATIGGSPAKGNSYKWTSNPAGYNSTSSSNSVSPSVTTTYKLIVTNTNGCSDSDSVTVKVLPLPTVPIGSSQTICAGNSVNIGQTAVSGLTYSWTSNPTGFTSSSANPSVNPTTTTTYTLSVSDGNGCTNSANVTITVDPLPTASVSSGKTTVCLGESITLGSAAVSGITYSWTSNPSGFTSSSANPTVTPAATTTYRLIVSNSNGCSDTDSVTITVYPVPTAKAGTAQIVCAGSSTVIGSPAVSGVNYSWTSIPSGFTSTTAEPTVNPTVSTWYILTATNTNGCSAKDSVQISVNPAPKVTVGSAQTICEGGSATIGSTHTYGIFYSWTSNPAGFTSTASNPTVTPAATTWYVLTATDSTHGCIGKDSVQITVNPAPAASAGAAQTICAGASVKIGNKAVSGNSYSWTSSPSGFTSALANPTVSPSATTVYTLTETNGSTGCTKTNSVTITVNPLPTAGSIAGSTSVCAGTLTSLRPSSAASGVTYSFKLGNYTSATAPTVVSSGDSAIIGWSEAGQADIWMFASNGSGCKDSAKVTVTINAKPAPSFTATTVCKGTATQFTNTTTGAVKSYWSFGDGDTMTASSPSHTYAAAGTYRVILLAGNVSGCYDTVSMKVVVNALPTVTYTVSGTCAGNSTTFTSTGASASTYKWDFGDGNNANTATATHTYAAAGSYRVVLTETNASGCGDSLVKTVTISAAPTAAFTASHGPGREYTFNATDNTQTGYSWNFGDSTSVGSGATATHTFTHSGTYHVKLTVTNAGGCSTTKDSAFTVLYNDIAEMNNSGFTLDIYPNPFSQKTIISYSIANPATVNIMLMDMTGRKIADLSNAMQTSGAHTYELDAAAVNLKSGVYFVNVMVNGASTTRRIIKVE